MQHLKHISTNIFPDITYRILGIGDALVLLHGFPDNGAVWDNIIELLSKDFTLIIPDLPCSTPELTVELMAESVKAILDNEGVKKAVIAGHSMGGYVALAFAEMYPYAVVGLSLIHSSPNVDDKQKIEVRKKAISIISRGGKEAFIKQMIPNLFSKSSIESNPELITKQVDKANMFKEECLIAFYNAMIKRPERSSVLKNGAFPVMWAIGNDDIITPYVLVKQHCISSNVNFVYKYPHCGHMSMLENPEKLKEDIKAFCLYCFW